LIFQGFIFYVSYFFV